MVETNDIVMWGAAFVALWWLFDWIHGRQEGERLPMRRAPMRVLGDVLPKLWRNKTFMLAVLCLWLIGATVAGVQGYFMRVSARPGAAEAAARQMDRPAALADAIPQLLTQELPEALPRLVEVPLGTWAAILFAVLLILGMVRIAIDPPDAIEEHTARGLWWPAGLLVLNLAAGIALLAAPRDFLEGLGYGGSAPPRSALMAIGTLVIMPALVAPVTALLWHLVLEIARKGTWSFVSSIRALAESWLPIVVVVIAAQALHVPATLSDPPGQRWWGIAYMLVLVVLALAPWAILDRKEGVLAGLRRSWRVVRLKPVDALAFGLRFTLLFAVLGGLVALAEPPARAVWAAWYAPLLDVVRNALILLQALVLARFYLHLSEGLGEDEACAGCPSPRTAERLGEQREEE